MILKYLSLYVDKMDDVLFDIQSRETQTNTDNTTREARQK